MKKINIDDIKVSSKLDTVINNAIDEGCKNREKKKHKRGIMVAATAAILFITLFGTNFRNEASANIRSMISGIGNFINIYKGLDDYKTIVNKKITKDGLSVQINDAILNGDELMVSRTYKSNIGIGEKDSIYGIVESIYINGKKVTYDLTNDARGIWRQIDEYTREGVEIYKLNEKDLSGDLDIKLKYERFIMIKEQKKGKEDKVLDLEGPWIFEFKVNGDMLVSDTEEKEINYEFELDGKKISLDKYALNRIGMKVFFNGDIGPYEIQLRGKDDLGKYVQLEMTTFNEENGVMTNTFKQISKEAKVLTVAPYVVIRDQKVIRDKDYKKVGEAFTIEINR